MSSATGFNPKSVGADKGYHNREWVQGRRERLIQLRCAYIEKRKVNQGHRRAHDAYGRLPRPSTFAPLGPKPQFVAMCLLASQLDGFPVYYAQPQTYASNYSIGCDSMYACWVKRNSVDLYAVD